MRRLQTKKRLLIFAKLTWIDDCAVPDFKRLSFKYDVIELTTSLKPFIAKKLLNEAQKVIFFDPDVMVFNSLSGILSELDSHSVLLTPHYFVPKTDTEINDMQLMRFGFHNLGFLLSITMRKVKNFWIGGGIDALLSVL